ncbi:hypothetical protein [uncultured Friedmanniella sp.]|uniref:hypothetical protein n=1 Tax=uncultured Friedmanniella sp. TaxID=335381 RepID=UPI0035CAACAF
MALYLDTSALVKLVGAEPQTAALRTWLAGGDRRPVSCGLARTELLRGCVGSPHTEPSWPALFSTQ